VTITPSPSVAAFLDPATGVVMLEGELDITAGAVLESAAEMAVAGDLIFDLAAVTLIDTMGLGALVRVWQLRGGQPRSVVLRHPNAQARLLLNLTGLGKLLPTDI
jgi:anti-anti-sigma factor